MKRNLMMMALAVVAAALFAPAAWAQLAIVKGTVKDQQGNPLANAQVQFVNLDNGRKYTLKTNKRGEFYSLAIQPGKFDVTLFGTDGKQIYQLKNVPVQYGEDNNLEIDLQKEMQKAQQQQQQQMTPEQKAEIEKTQKENAKIKGLNDKLAAATQAQDAGNLDQAVQILSEATQMDPTRDLLWFKLADAERLWASKTTGDPAQQKERYEKAVQDYQKAIAIKPQGAYYNNLGEALAKSGDTQKAVEAYSQAATTDPTDAGRYYFNEGAVLTNTGKIDDAIAAFDKAIQADPNKADAYYWKGVNMLGKATLGKDGKMVAPEGTAEAFNKYLELAPTGPYADASKQMLQTMGAKVETTFGKGKAAKKK